MLQPHRNLSQLPNFAFSVALAHFHSSKQEGERKRADEMVSDSIIFIRSDEGLTLETSAFQIFHGGNSTFINSFDKTKFLF